VLPVAVNNLFGDPCILLDDTVSRLRALRDDPWAGPVGLITKGSWTNDRVQRIKEVAPGHLVVLVSISSLVRGGEAVSVDARLRTISEFAKAEIPVIGYARPLTDADGAANLVRRMRAYGASAVVVSGFRGTPEMGSRLGVSDPSIRVKEMPRSVSEALRGLGTFARTSCGAAFALGLRRSWNPYWVSPQLAGCATCPLRATCYDAPAPEPSPAGLAAIARLGYSVAQSDAAPSRCSVKPENRRGCKSCCTTCYIHPHGAWRATRVDGRTPNLGDLSFVRHLLGGVHAYAPDVVDDGGPDVARVSPPVALPTRILALNTWLSYSSQTERCFGCPYCIVPHYEQGLGPVGMLPSALMGTP
jgi:hypothetical protein